jgi:DNA-binding transcriptional MerR regulator
MARLLAFTPDQVASITGLSRRQLDYWGSTGFYTPEFRRETGRYNRMYSFRDVVGLKAIARLRTHLPLQELRRAGKWLQDRYDQPWSELRLLAVDGKVVLDDFTGHRRAAGTDQLVLIDLGELESEVERQSADLYVMFRGLI